MPSTAWTERDGGALADLLSSIREFVLALTDRHTYRPTRNPYALFGLLWGMPIPFFSICLDAWASARPLSLSLVLDHPIHFVFLAHPFLFAVVFSAMGTVRGGKDRQIAVLVEEMQRQVTELESANERLKELDQLKAQFIANVTHELKTPLVSIRGYNEAILEGRFGALNDKQRDGLATAMRNIERLQGLIEEILEFERIDAGELAIEASDFDLVPLLQEAVRTLQPRLEARAIRTEIRMPAEVRVRADREKIARVFLNLLSNAIKFSLDGGKLGVDGKIEEDGRSIHLTVWDRGCGIPAGLQKHLFTRFWQAGRRLSDKSEGTGLGLVITKGLLEAHGSTIEVVSAEGAGTMVHFKLPLAVGERAAVQEPQDGERKSSAPAGGSGRRA